tara:strand:+ start:3197 stop:3493 length:297 start_codon:yes stop_codon:yes gene_type:complete
MAVIMNYERGMLRPPANKCLAKNILVGDQLDLYGDKYADPNYDLDKCFEFEYATVDNVEIESCGRCILVETDNGCFGFPSDHEVKKAPNFHINEGSYG